MTNTGHWLREERTRLVRGETLSSALVLCGVVLGALAVGVLVGQLGLYELAPPGIVLTWGIVVAAGLWAWRRLRRRAGAIDDGRIASEVESTGGLRRGSIGGIAVRPSIGSSALIEAADANARSWLETHGSAALSPARTRTRRAVRTGGLTTAVGLVLFAAVGPGTGRGSTFWRPATVLAASTGTIRIEVDRARVRRGDSVRVTITSARPDVFLVQRAPGEPWREMALSLDSTGTVTVTLGPLQADRYLKAVNDRRESETVHVEVAVPAFLAELSLYARFPAYIDRSDEPLLDGDSVLLPVGTRLLVNGRATVPVGSAAWEVEGGVSIALETNGSRIEGETAVTRGGRWQLSVRPVEGSALVEETPSLYITTVADSLPLVTVPVPGVDTVAPTSLRQPVVADVRDDYGLTLVTLTSWRGVAGEDAGMTDTLFVPQAAADRAVLSWVLDLNDRGFESGDTAYYRVSAFDNAPRRQVGHSQVYALRLPSTAELRQAIRDAADAMVAESDSLAQAQRELSRETENLAAAGERAGEENAEQLDFEAAERAAEAGKEQSDLMDRAQELAQQLEELAKASWEAEMTDPEWHEKLAELQEMLEQAVTPEMEASLEELQDALKDLDPEAVRRALEELAEQQQKLQEQLERSQELFERAALEGAMSTMADDVESLAEQQQEWNADAQQGEKSDSALAASEQQLADQAEQLRQEMERMQEAMEESSQSRLQRSGEQMQQAGQKMGQASSQAQQGQSEQAQQSGQQASDQLNPMSEDLREQLEQMREEWRQEVLQEMDQALTETADLAQREENLTQRMERGESSGEIRGEQAALREGVDRVIERLQNAAGKNALVSPQLSTALGFARVRMSDALEQFEQPTPNSRQAAEMAAQAVDGLNAVAAALMRNRGDVENSSSGSGMAEAMQQMAEMAQQQDALNAETGSLMPLMPQGGQELIQQLQQLAQQQQSMGDQLEEMAAEEGLPGALEEMAEEAMEIAEELAAGQVDRETIERQEQLFKRLLDAGRSLRSDEEDEQKDRESVTAQQDNVALPPELDPASTGAGVRYPYPTWEQLRRFSPEERRIILDYFRRLNTGRP